jgi:hypothetical protein
MDGREPKAKRRRGRPRKESQPWDYDGFRLWQSVEIERMRFAYLRRRRRGESIPPPPWSWRVADAFVQAIPPDVFIETQRRGQILPDWVLWRLRKLQKLAGPRGKPFGAWRSAIDKIAEESGRDPRTIEQAIRRRKHRIFVG